MLRTRFTKWCSTISYQKHMTLEDYKKELNGKEGVIQELKTQNMLLHDNINDLTSCQEPNNHVKGAAKLFSTICSKVISNHSVRAAFETWKSDYEVHRIMENAFNKVLEMNHKHVCVRVSSGVGLLNNIVRRRLEKPFEDLGASYTPSSGTGIRSPTPKFSHSQNILCNDEYSSSLHDSTLFLNKFQAKGKNRKSLENTMFMF